MTWVYIWLAVIVVALVIEFITLDLVSVWIAAGALIGMILALCKVGVEIQIIVAVVVSLACIIGLRKITLKLLNRNQGKTNLDLAIGTKVKLLTPITKDDDGSAKYNGVVWTVKCEGDEIAEGEYAVIEKVEGNKLIVKKVEESKKAEETVQTSKESEKASTKKSKKTNN